MSLPSHMKGEILRPGKACLHCKARKVKCDAVRPICTPCSRGNRAAKCEYADQEIYDLEENISRLEKRLKELEAHGQQPSCDEATAQLSSTQLKLNQSDEELPPLVRVFLVNLVISYSRQLGFAMNKDRFLATLALSPADPNYPSPALLHSVYLWGLCILNCEQFFNLERRSLEKAKLYVADALNSRDPKTRFQALQAEILLAQYFFCAGRPLEGRYHTGAASSLALSSGLQYIRGVIPPNALTPDLVGSISAFEFPPPRDAIEEGERINIFWVTYNVDRCWSVAMDRPAYLSSPITPRSPILTPWPMEFQDYASGMTPHNRRELLDFVLRRQKPDSIHPAEFSIPSLRVKASALFYSASMVVADPHRSTPMERLKGLTREMSEQSIGELLEMLPPLHHMDNLSSEDQSAYIVIRGIVLASRIQLHFVAAENSCESYAVCLLTAKCIVDIVEFIAEHTTIFFLDPIVSAVWTSAAQSLARDLSRSPHTSIPSSTAESSRADAVRMCNGLKEIIKRKPLMTYPEAGDTFGASPSLVTLYKKSTVTGKMSKRFQF
ncbi:hypothetical protein BD410DRAFT_832822 [Rickenella mellea]|uniref:Zn(2)-C6 fungal-type domain-containing protein n=1 Tax=Rickenella mellea TaxID=50990 RepID=A0A4Y7PIY0_9AGAM|nr:hypothetical protein BD410DRAFT_832822 [Rickenella mellea]